MKDLNVKLSDTEHAALKRAAKEQEMTVTTFLKLWIRTRLMGRGPTERKAS